MFNAVDTHESEAKFPSRVHLMSFLSSIHSIIVWAPRTLIANFGIRFSLIALIPIFRYYWRNGISIISTAINTNDHQCCHVISISLNRTKLKHTHTHTSALLSVFPFQNRLFSLLKSFHLHDMVHATFNASCCSILSIFTSSQALIFPK